ncbi:MAG: cupin domain-containing protein [Pyrinomonadaceae bacterium]|nr:cupin domain-containing protein [Sphingobacteriaceae bacterium]
MNIRDHIESGILELYVLGQTTPDETILIQKLAASDESIRNEILEIELSLEKYAQAHAVEPDAIIKPFLLAMLDYMDRMQNGEKASTPPLLHAGSNINDYLEWLNRADMVIADDFNDVYAKIINYTPEIVTAIVWIKEMAPQEVHEDQFERFLIIEGTCDIVIDDEVHQLVPGDFLTIPLHKAHHVKVTSTIPCKAILQRVAA